MELEHLLLDDNAETTQQPEEHATDTEKEQHEIQKFLQKYDVKRFLAELKEEEDQEQENAAKVQNRAQDANFRKQRDTMFKKAERMRATFEADVFILMRRKARISGYCGKANANVSTTSKWPLDFEEIVG
jgi:hypothetical protein